MKRTLATIAIGAVPIAGLALLSHFLPRVADEQAVRLGVCTALGALWGLVVGTLRRSLLRAIVGLNAGALCGYAFNAVALNDSTIPSEGRAIVGLILAGAALGAVLNFQRVNFGHAFKGALAGVMAFGFMGCAAWVVAQLFRPTLLGWTVMCLVPFGGGIALFIGLVGKEPQAANVASPRPNATVKEYDHERGGGASSAAQPIPGANSATDARAS